MNAGIFADCYLPTRSGVVTSIVQLKEGLERKGHRAVILTVATPPWDEKDPTVYRLPSIPFNSANQWRLGLFSRRSVNRRVQGTARHPPQPNGIQHGLGGTTCRPRLSTATGAYRPHNVPGLSAISLFREVGVAQDDPALSAAVSGRSRCVGLPVAQGSELFPGVPAADRDRDHSKCSRQGPVSTPAADKWGDVSNPESAGCSRFRQGHPLCRQTGPRETLARAVARAGSPLARTSAVQGVVRWLRSRS